MTRLPPCHHAKECTMAKSTLTFTLPDEEADLRDAMQGRDAKLLLWEIDQRLRAVVKYEDDASEDRVALAEEIREMIRSDARVTLG